MHIEIAELKDILAKNHYSEMKHIQNNRECILDIEGKIEDVKKCDISTGNTYDWHFFVEDAKNKVKLLVKAVPLDCCGTIDWSCIVGYNVYIYKSEKDKTYIGHIRYMNPQSLRRLYTKTLPLVIYNNPYGGETDMLRKRVNPNSKNFSGNIGGYYTFTWSACGGATFCLHHYENGTYELKTSEKPDDCWDWSTIENFKVNEYVEFS